MHGLVASTDKAAYVASKHGVLGLTKVVALETATTGITCNAICPGWVLTPLVEKQIDDLAARQKLSVERASNCSAKNSRHARLPHRNRLERWRCFCAPIKRRRFVVRRSRLTALGPRNNYERTSMRITPLKDAVARIPNGASLMIGGFMGVGTPERVIDELLRQGTRDLTVIGNDTAMPGIGIGKLISANAVRKVVASHIGLNPETQRKCSPAKSKCSSCRKAR